jgi:hypothetical protein
MARVDDVVQTLAEQVDISGQTAYGAIREITGALFRPALQTA